MKPFLDLQCLQRNRLSAVLLQSWLCSRGRTCLSAGICLVQLLCSWRYKCEYVSMSRICDVTRGTDHVVRFTRPSLARLLAPSILAQFLHSLVPRLPRSGTRTLKLCRRGEPGILCHVKSAKGRKEVEELNCAWAYPRSEQEKERRQRATYHM